MRIFTLLVAMTLMVGCGDFSGPTSPSAVAGGTTESNSPHPPGQHPSGNPAHAPGCSNPNTVPSSDCKKDK